MSEFFRPSPGQRSRQLPALTLSRLVIGELATRAEATDQPSHPAAETRSPVHVQLHWTGETPLKPGAAVKLGTVLVAPGVDASVPFDELRFNALPFEPTDPAATPYALTLEPIEPSGLGGGVIPNAGWARVYISDPVHQYATKPSSGTQLQSATAGLRILWKPFGLEGEQWCVIQLSTEGSETYRLIRGQSIGANSGATLLIDNIVVLSGGVDPSGGNPAAAVVVANIFSNSFADNEWLDAVYSPGVSAIPAADWETLKSTSGEVAYRLITGIVTADVAPETNTFNVDNIELLAGSADPRSTPGSTTETLAIFKFQFEALTAGDTITAAYLAGTDSWLLLNVERFRAIRGTVYSQAGTTVTIENVVALDNGIDPRTDPTDASEHVDVEVVNGEKFVSGQNIWADWNAKGNQWEARPNSVARFELGRIYGSPIPKATEAAGDVDPGDGQVTLYDRKTGDPTKFDAGSHVDVENWSKKRTFAVDEQVLVGTTPEGDRFLIPLENVPDSDFSEQTIKVPTSIELVIEAGEVKVKLHYEEKIVWAKDPDPAVTDVLEGSVADKEC